jgi:hypothetical protein
LRRILRHEYIAELEKDCYAVEVSGIVKIEGMIRGDEAKAKTIGFVCREND